MVVGERRRAAEVDAVERHLERSRPHGAIAGSGAVAPDVVPVGRRANASGRAGVAAAGRRVGFVRIRYGRRRHARERLGLGLGERVRAPVPRPAVGKVFVGVGEEQPAHGVQYSTVQFSTV